MKTSRVAETIGWSLLALALAAPTASAVTTVDPDDEGISVCRMVQGRDVCVALFYGACDLWVSAGMGVCVEYEEDEPESTNSTAPSGNETGSDGGTEAGTEPAPTQKKERAATDP